MTLGLTLPFPMGVVIGALRPTPISLMAAIVSSGTIGLPASTHFSPASTSTHSISTFAAFRTVSTAATSSGPVPSPRIRQDLCMFNKLG